VGRAVSIFLLGVAACAPPPPRTVPRVVNGQLEEGAFVSPYAYEWFIEGEVSAAKGEHDDAALALETATAAPSEDVLLMTRLAEEYEMSGASRRADRTLVLARRSYPESAQVELTDGRINRYRGDLDEAMKSFLEAKRLAPKWEEPVIELGETLRAQGHPLRASALLIEYITTSYEINTEGARRALVDLARSGGDAETLQRALALGAGSNAEREALLAAELAFDTGQPALAARLLASTVGAPENRMLWLRALMASGDRKTARDFLASAESGQLGGPGAHAELLIEIDEPDPALELLQTAGTSPRVQYAKGVALLGSGDYLAASRALSDVPPGSSTFEAARIAFAESSEAQRRTGAAAEALSLAPHDSLAVRVKLAELYLVEGNLRAGLRLFDARLASDRAAVASLFERAGHYQEAAAYYATVEANPSEDPRIHARAAAERLAARGLYGPATTILERWTATAPDDLYARVRLVELLHEAGHHEAATEKGRATLPFIDDSLLRAHLVDVLATRSILAE
jgi:tetratricopeptide (TPR) repeat protein